LGNLDNYIDPKYKAEDSLLLRYHKAVSGDDLDKKDLEGVSLKEGARIQKLIDHKGVSVYINDESTLMSGGTYKALEACLGMALCKKRGYKKVAFSSGANIGSSLTIYGERSGIETFFFHPTSTDHQLDGALFSSGGAHLISVDKPEKEVKKAALLFAEKAGIPHIPEIEWRLRATAMRAFFVFESILNEHMKFDWITQTVCAGYGPIGFYNAVQRLLSEGVIEKEHVPKFLGVQQEVLSPMVKAWQSKHDHILSRDVTAASGELLAPTLYNTNPEASYPMLYKHLVDFGGQLFPVSREDFNTFLPLLMEKLPGIGINLTMRNTGGKEEILEKAGLIGICGTLKAIEDGILKKGDIVLSFLTGGASKYSGKQAVPEYKIEKDDDLERSVEKYLNKL